MNIEIINQGDDLKSRMAGHSVALYVIKGDCILSENATIPAGSVLKFEDGRIINNRTDGETVTLSGSRIIVDAPKTQIFGSGVLLHLSLTQQPRMKATYEAYPNLLNTHNSLPFSLLSIYQSYYEARPYEPL